MVNNVFYTNSGSGKFLSGGISGIKTLQQTTLFKVYKIPRLPSEYQEVEWIKSHGTEYIELDIYQRKPMSLEMKFNYYNSNDWLFLSTGENPAPTGIPILSQLYVQRNRVIFGNTADQYNQFIDFANNIYPANTDIDVNLDVTSSLATLSGTRSGTFVPGDVSTHKIVIFGRDNEQGGGDTLSSMKLYKLKITTSTTSNSCELIPCYRKDRKLQSSCQTGRDGGSTGWRRA